MAGDPLIFPSVSLMASTPSELLVRSKEIAGVMASLDRPYGESKSSVDYVKNHYGKSSFQYLDGLGVLNKRFVADHAVWVDHEEMEIMAEKEVKVITNPESNMKLASGWAPVHRYIERGIVVGLGTDGCASNNNLDLFGEMDTLAKLHKIYDRDPTHMEASSVLKLATVNGAKALGLEDRIGTLKAGKRADIIVVDFNKPQPRSIVHSPIWSMLPWPRTSGRLVNGILVRDRAFTQADQAEIMARPGKSPKE
jgi:5-methylthioadenosine/S-adenosylhomocysteine deaminase